MKRINLVVVVGMLVSLLGGAFAQDQLVQIAEPAAEKTFGIGMVYGAPMQFGISGQAYFDRTTVEIDIAPQGYSLALGGKLKYTVADFNSSSIEVFATATNASYFDYSSPTGPLLIEAGIGFTYPYFAFTQLISSFDIGWMYHPTRGFVYVFSYGVHFRI